MTEPLQAWEALQQADPAAAAQVLDQLKKSVFVPHEGGQREVMASPARFRVLRAGRRWGKTQLAAHEVIRAALAKDDQMVWWVSNTDKNVRRGYRAVKKQLPRMLLAKEPPSDQANDRILTFKNGSQIEFYTAGSPDSLAGEGVDFVVMDEAALIPEMVWQQLVRPTLSDTDGRALLISTPRGKNWFYKSWHFGKNDSKPFYESWHFPTVASPYVPDYEVEDARDTLPAILFAQEYEAEFTDNAASIFTLEGEVDGISWTAVRPKLVQPAGWVTLGIDLAKKEDFTVISGCNTTTREPCVYERFNDITWPAQQRIILDLRDRLVASPLVEGLTVVVDGGGVGDVVVDHLEEAGMDVVGVNFGSGLIKETMARLLAADLEHGRAFIIEDQRDEFEHYEYEITPNGRFKFAAPEGEHDDKVSAKMLENWGVVQEAPPGIQIHDPEAAYEDGSFELEPVAVDTGEVEEELIRPDSARSIARNPLAWS